jgi:hypothetical protein
MYNYLYKKYNIRIISKKNSKLMKLISFILFFNKSFISNFVTTIGNNIYVPESFYNLNERQQKVIICHELVHIMDKKNDKLFIIKYLFPQILVLFCLFSFFNILFLFFLIFIFPIPSFFRKNYELRAYKVSLLVQKIYGFKNIEDYIDIYNNVFTNSSYYYMWPWGVKKELLDYYLRIKDLNFSDIENEDYFEIIKEIV